MPRNCRSGFAPWSNFFSHIQDKICGHRSTRRANRRRPAIRMARAVGYGVEAMEERLLFTTITGSGVLEYFDNKQNTIRVAYHDVTADLIFVTVDKVSDVASETNQVFPSDPAPPQGANLFTIDITQSNLDSYISIAQVPAITTAGPRPMEPFTGSAGPFAISDAQGLSTGLITFSPPGDSGVALLGAVHNGALAAMGGPAAGQPIVTVPFGGAGSVGGVLTAGVYMTATDPATGLPNDMGKFLFGGTIFGNVSFLAPAAGTVAPAPATQGGNVGLFYAGCILTGNANGSLQAAGASASDQTPNFVVGGDLRDLITSGPIGGDPAGGTDVKPQYLTGFNASIAGTVGEIYQREGGFFGAINAQHNPAIFGLPSTLLTETQWQFHIENGEDPGDIFQGSITGTPQLPAPFNIGSADTPQYLGSISTNTTDTQGNLIYQAQVSGTFQGVAGDTDNYYAIPLLAGQSITIAPSTGQLLQTQLIDPDGRTVASDENLLKPTVTLDSPFQYTADRAGIYKIRLTNLPGLTLNLDVSYTLTVSGVGDMGLGALVAQAGDVSDGGYDNAFVVGHGDLGAVIAGQSLVSTTIGPAPAAAPLPTPPPTTFTVSSGNLRTLMGASIGDMSATTTTLGGAPYLDVPFGTVGLVRATDAGGALLLQTRFDPNSPNGETPYSAVGGNFQMIDGAGTVGLMIATNKGIGVIRAGNMATLPASFIDVNADNTGNDGIIDLIDCTGDFGTLTAGGPAIITHTGGDVRYIQVGGNVYQDSFFGGGFPTNTTYAAGEAANITDDSGSSIHLQPAGDIVTTTTTDPTTGATTTTTVGPQLTLTTYGIRDKGGVVLIKVSSTGGLNITTNGSRAEIGEIDITGSGSPVIPAVNANGLPIVDSNGEQILQLQGATTTTGGGGTTTGTSSTQTVGTGTSSSANPPSLSLTINGTAECDVLKIVATGDVTAITNATPGGELPIVEAAGTIGTLLSHGTLGMAKSTTGEAVNPSAILADGNTYPWNHQSIGIEASGNVLLIEAFQGIGNVFVHGDIGNVVPDAINKPTPGTFAGINGAIVADGRILNVDVGQGILPTGTGDVGFAGLFATGDIGTVTNHLAQADIRGNVVSTSAIDYIGLTNASIINAGVYVVTDFAQTQAISDTPLTSPTLVQTVNNPQFNLKNINIQGRGGIIGANVFASDIGNVTVGKKGFGILNSDFEVVGTGVFGAITAGGYGIRGTSFHGGAGFQSINATGNGSNLPVNVFPADLRQSESSVQVDPFFGIAPSPLTDLDAYLGTSAGTPSIPGVTDTGVLEDVVAIGSTYLQSLRAQTVRVSAPIFTPVQLPTIPTLNIPQPGKQFATEFDFANFIGAINIRGNVDGMQLTTGRINSFKLGGNVSRCGIAVAGPIKALTFHGNFGQTVTDPSTGNTIPDSYISAVGVDGVIGTLTVKGNLFGNVTATRNIGRMTIGGNVVGSINAQGSAGSLALSYLRVGGTIQNGSLTIIGNAGSIITNGSLGLSTDSLTITGNVKLLSVGASRKQSGSSLALALHVEGTLSKLLVHGRIDGTVTVDGDLGNLQVVSDGTTGNILNGNVSVGGRLGTAKIIGGNVNADVTSNGSINSFTITRGSVLTNHTIQSLLESIRKFRITGGSSFGLLGSLLAPNGTNEQINISGNFGDGTTPASITAFSGTNFRIGGSILSNTTIAITDALNLLQVNGDIDAGAAVSAHPLKKLKVGGQTLGSVTTV